MNGAKEGEEESFTGNWRFVWITADDREVPVLAQTQMARFEGLGFGDVVLEGRADGGAAGGGERFGGHGRHPELVR